MWQATVLVAAAALCQCALGATTVFSYPKPTGEGGALLASYVAKWNLTALAPGGELLSPVVTAYA
jgi:predicted membrane protein